MCRGREDVEHGEAVDGDGEGAEEEVDDGHQADAAPSVALLAPALGADKEHVHTHLLLLLLLLMLLLLLLLTCQ